nr:MAG TPA: defensin [Caudoviricetes sp.]
MITFLQAGDNILVTHFDLTFLKECRTNYVSAYCRDCHVNDSTTRLYSDVINLLSANKCKNGYNYLINRKLHPFYF